jgi:hypothetical protein
MSVVVLERVTRVAPFGLRVVDAATRAAVSEGIEVTVGGTRATTNTSGVFVTHAVAPGTYTVAVRDVVGRFLPLELAVDVPVETLVEAPLLPAPARPVPPGFAAVRAQLRDAVLDEPAAGAVLEVAPPDMPAARGAADARGAVLVIFPYPEPLGEPGSPPSTSTLRPLGTETWPVRVRALYRGPARLLASTSPPTELTEATLAYGRELILRTDDLSELLLEPGE